MILWLSVSGAILIICLLFFLEFSIIFTIIGFIGLVNVIISLVMMTKHYDLPDSSDYDISSKAEDDKK